MALAFAAHADLVLTTGAAAQSNIITEFWDAYGLSIVAPATLTSTAITILVTNSTVFGATLATLQSGGTDVVLTAGKSLTITPVAYRQLQLQGSAVEVAARTFTVAKVFPT